MKQHTFVAQSATHFTVKGVEHYIQFQVHKDHCHYINEMMSDVEGELRVSFKTNKEDKTLKQLRLFFKILSLISDKVNGSHAKDEIEQLYKYVLQQAQIKVDYLLAPQESKTTLESSFRIVEDTHQTRTVNDYVFTVFKVYRGLSQFDKQETSAIIDELLKLASSYDIETSDTVDLRKLKEK